MRGRGMGGGWGHLQREPEDQLPIAEPELGLSSAVGPAPSSLAAAELLAFLLGPNPLQTAPYQGQSSRGGAKHFTDLIHSYTYIYIDLY